MTEPEFLEAEAVLFVHDQALESYGGLPGVRDEGLLHSALGRPVNKFTYSEPGTVDLFDLAAAYAYGVAKKHPFNDGNKRSAWSTSMLFLSANGIRLTVPADDLVEQTVRLASGALTEEAFAAWLRSCYGPAADVPD